MLFSLISYGQAGGSGFGLKAGINFNSNGDLKINEVPEINPDAGVGFHVGVWGRLGGVAYVRPELVYTEINSDYDGETFKMAFSMDISGLPSSSSSIPALKIFRLET
jgi:hypothetical protein